MSCETIDEILKWLEEQEKQDGVTIRGKDLIQNLKFRLRCVRIFIKWVKDGFYLYIMRTWIKIVERLLLQEERNGSMGRELLDEALSSLSSEPLEKKLKYECHRYFELGFSILSFGFHDRSVQIDEIVLDCIDPLLGMFMHLRSCNNISLQEAPWKKPIAAFMEKLGSIRNFIMFTKRELDKLRISIRSDWWQSEDLLTKVKRLLENAVFVCCKWSIGGLNGRMEELFICLEVKAKHLEPDIRMSYAKFLRASANPAGCLGIDLQALASLDSLLDNLNKLLKEQDADSVLPPNVPQIEFLHSELSFLKYFLMDPDLEQYAETKEQTFTSLLIQLEALARRASVIHSTFFGQTNDEWNQLNFNLLETVNLLKVEIRKIYQGVPKPSESSYLHTPDLGFLDDFLQSLDELQNHKADALSYVKNEIGIIQRQLRYMSSLISDAIRRLEEDKHIIVRRVLDVAHEAEHVIDLISASNLPYWYYMLWLSEVIEKMKMLTKDMTKVDKMTSSDINMENAYCSHDRRPSYNVAAEEEVVGFQDETENGGLRGYSYMNHRMLNKEESWELLQKMVFQKRGCPRELYTVGKEIATFCKGLPLSVMVIAGILKNIKESETHWREISESLGNKDGYSRDILELSYKHLPDHLKLCFLYLGTFSKYTEVSTKKLIRMWVANGLVRKTKSAESLEKVAKTYLMDLISRNLVFISKIKSHGGVKSCGLHDLLHEFSIEKFNSLIPFHERLIGEPYARSTFFVRSGSKHGLFYDVSILPYFFRSLRVLNLGHISLESDKFPIGIEQLVHLRYLAIQGRLKYVPTTVANLWRLETFIVKVSNGDLVNLPESLLEMAYLKDVRVNKASFSLPGGTFRLENSFESSGIESLSTVTLCHGNDTTEKLIRRLRNLRKLKCVFLISREDRFPIIDMFSKLESLIVTYHDRRIPLPPPSEFSFPSTLKKLTLSRFAFRWREICEIGRRLPKLEVLKLLDKASSGNIWRVTYKEFLNLKFLRLEGLDIIEWYSSLGAFPCLEGLVIQRCPNLQILPSTFGESTSLKMIKMPQCMFVTRAAQKIHKRQQCLRPNQFKLLIQEDERYELMNLFPDLESHLVPEDERYEPMNWFPDLESHSVPEDERYEPMNWFPDPESHLVSYSNSDSDADFDSDA